MPERLTAAAPLAAALCLAALAAAAPPARGKQDNKPTTPSTAAPPTLDGVPPGDPKLPRDPGKDLPVTARDPADGPFKASEVTKKAVITWKEEPGFTEEARRNDVYGVVRLRALLSSSGKVTNITVVKGLPDGLTERAIKAARAIKFRPAQKDGRAVSQWVTLEYNFNTDEDENVVERRAVILEQPAPAYTEEARRQGVAGKVVLEVALRGDGRAYVRQVVERLPHGLTERAVEAAGKIRFTPAEHKGRKVDVVRRIEYVFSPD